MAEGVEIGKGTVTVGADLSSFDAAMNALPKKAAAKMDAAMKALQAKAAQTKLELKSAYKAGDLEAQQKLLPIYESLRAKIDSVTAATVRQAQAIQATALASVAQAQAQQRNAANAARVAATGQGMNSVWLDQQMAGKLDKVGEAGKKAGDQVKQGGSNGAMGLMVLSQTIDDAQYGLSAVVNNMPQVGMAIGQALGVSTEKAMAFGGAMGIAAVAVNTWVKNGDHVKAIFGREQSEDVKELATQLTTLGDTARSLFATLANLDGGFNWVSATSKDTAALEKQMADKAAFAAKAAERAKSNRSAVAGIKESGADERGAGFTKAVEGYGGGDKLASDIANQRMGKAGLGGLKKEDRERREKMIREGVDADIAAAKEGDKGAAGRLGADSSRLAGFVKFNAPGAKEGRDKQARENDASATKTAKSLEDTVGRELIKNPDMKGLELLVKIMEAMEKAGYSTKEIANTLPAVATKLKADIEGQVKDRAVNEGIDPAEARKQLLAESLDKEKREQSPAKREAERLAGAMQGGVGQKLLKNGGMGDEELEREVKKGLKASGMDDAKINESVSLVAQKLREKVEAQVQERALGEGVSEGKARQDMLAEANERKNKDQPKSEVMSEATYLNKALVASLSKSKDDVPKDQLTEAKTTNSKLDTVIKVLGDQKKSGPATFGPGR